MPIDFSEGSREALRHALFIGERLGARVDALHVWEPAPYLPATQLGWFEGDPTVFWTQMRDDLEARLDELVDELAGPNASNVGRRVELGYVAASILQAVEEDDYDMVVMGTHGRTGLSHLLLGSIAEKVVRNSPAPVLTVRAPPRKERSERAASAPP